MKTSSNTWFGKILIEKLMPESKIQKLASKMTRYEGRSAESNTLLFFLTFSTVLRFWCFFNFWKPPDRCWERVKMSFYQYQNCFWITCVTFLKVVGATTSVVYPFASCNLSTGRLESSLQTLFKSQLPEIAKQIEKR